jgi:hypothetical protein
LSFWQNTKENKHWPPREHIICFLFTITAKNEAVSAATHLLV